MKVAYVFPPPCDPKFPPYAMALLAGSTKHHRHRFFGFDLNVDLFHAASEEDKALWDGQNSARWYDESDRVIRKYDAFLEDYISRILQLNLSLYALYTSHCSKEITLFVARKIKENNPKASIILGGPQCFPAFDGVAILENNFVDAICTGEGDSIWPTILEEFSQTGSLHIDAPGIAYRQSDGTVVDGGVPRLVDNLDTIPYPDYSFFDFSRYGATEGEYYQLSTMTSRGCINTCAFCSDRPSSYKYRYRSAENIFEEIIKTIGALLENRRAPRSGSETQALCEPDSSTRNFLFRVKQIVTCLRSGSQKSRLHCLKGEHSNTGESAVLAVTQAGSTPAQWEKAVPYIYFSFNDSLINGSPRELERFCDLVIESGLKFKWGGMALLRSEMKRDLLTKMKEAGCHNLAWGLESGSQQVLNLMHKRFFDMDLAKEIIRETYAVGIRQSIALVVGFPGETEEMFQETVQFLREYKSCFERIGAQTMKIYHNSVVHDKYEDFGLDFENAQEFTEWSTVDGSNCYETRLKRLNMLEEELGDQMITIDR